MKKLESLAFLIVCALCLSLCCCNGEEGEITFMSAPMKRTEQDSLYSAIQDFVGKWWNGSDLYPDPCGWTPIQGVSCDLFDGFWYVTDLSIGQVHDNSLICAQNVDFSPHLFALTHLKTLSFFSCFVSPSPLAVSLPMHNWGAFAESLVSLEFRSNPGLTGQIPWTFTELKTLESLVLVENGLTCEIVPDLGNLTTLKRLNLAGNKLTGPIPASLGSLNHLLILDLSQNSLSGPLPDSLGGMTSLLKLDLSNNRLDGKIPDRIGNLKNLTLLDLSRNKLSGELTKSLQDLTSLDELVLSGNLIGGSLANLEWENLVRVGALDLSNMVLTGTIPESLTGLKNLRFLGLNDNKLSGEITPNLANLPNLGAMYFHGNNLTGELKFSEVFYQKMGRRFGAWGNPNLCYRIGSNPAPFGVKLCKEETMKYETGLKAQDQGHWNQELSSTVSLAFRARDYGGLTLVIEALVILISRFGV